MDSGVDTGVDSGEELGDERLFPVRVLTDLSFQSISGLTDSSQGIPRMIEWIPRGATTKV